MGKKFKISQKRKDYIKDNLSKIKISELKNAEEIRYYNYLKAIRKPKKKIVKKKPGKKLNIDQKRKDYIKKNFSKIKISKLKSKEEKRYYKLVKQGRKPKVTEITFRKKILRGEIVDIIKKVAAIKGMSIDAYLKKHKADVADLIDNGFTALQRRPDQVIDAIKASPRKRVQIIDFDGNIEHDLPKNDVIREIATLQQYAASNSTIVQLGIETRVHLDGKINVIMPIEEDYDGMSAEDFEDLLDDFDVWFVKSDKTE